jgi:hypothetical protein
MRRNRLSFAILLLTCSTFYAANGAFAESKYKVIYSFQNTDGAHPTSDLTLDAAGNLYGTSGGGNGTECNGGPCGTVFELERTPTGWKHHVLYAFQGGNDGGLPLAGVTFDSAGNLFGTTSFLGPEGYGTVFKLTPKSNGGWTEEVIYSFSLTGEAGNTPDTDLVFDNQGNLYGTTANSSTGQACINGCGAVFELAPQVDGSWTETTLHAFTGSPDGGDPSSPVILDSAGNVYGVTEIGGTGVCFPQTLYEEELNCGTAYKLEPGAGGWKESIIYNFVRGGGNAVYPSGALNFDENGNLYGTSFAGGNGYGSVFELHPREDGTWWQSQQHMFYGKPDGRELFTDFAVLVLGRLVMDPQGEIFGVNTFGGAEFGGVVFKLQAGKSGWRTTILHAFPSTGSAVVVNPGLVSDAEGHLYSVTQYGGSTSCSGGCGTVYEITP